MSPVEAIKDYFRQHPPMEIVGYSYGDAFYCLRCCNDRKFTRKRDRALFRAALLDRSYRCPGCDHFMYFSMTETDRAQAILSEKENSIWVKAFRLTKTDPWMARLIVTTYGEVASDSLIHFAQLVAELGDQQWVTTPTGFDITSTAMPGWKWEVIWCLF